MDVTRTVYARGMAAPPRHGHPLGSGGGRDGGLPVVSPPGWCPVPLVETGSASGRTGITTDCREWSVARPGCQEQRAGHRESATLSQRHQLVLANRQAGVGTDSVRRRPGGDSGDQDPGSWVAQIRPGSGVVRATQRREGDQSDGGQQGPRVTVTVCRSLARHVSNPLSITRRASTITRPVPRDQ